MAIIYPLFVLVLLTFVVGFSVGASRLISIKKGHVDPRYYKLMSGYDAPAYVQKFSRNFSNLLETPILLYILGVLVIVLNIESSIIVGLAWVFVSLRFVHSSIHLTYNNSKHRLYSFALSGIVLLVMWIELFNIVSHQL
ncbi:MAG: MAPEG family protein [Pseudomonadales bacterium]|nr:MAPEG family protein [Pseudomonadales bacterium]